LTRVATIPDAFPPDYDKANAEQQLAFRAGREDAAKGRPMKGMLD
jgi:hypothetical protein